jgi:periplasmic protein TonB
MEAFMKMRVFQSVLIFIFLTGVGWGGEPVRIDKNSMHVELTKQVKPVYPKDAKKEHITGPVVLDATVNEQGKVIEVKVTKSANPLLEASAIEAVKQWEFAPLKIKGKPVSFITSITINFALGEDPVKPATNN